jgi:hypothetical protein
VGAKEKKLFSSHRVFLYLFGYFLNQVNDVNRLFVVCHFVMIFFKCNSTSHQ